MFSLISGIGAFGQRAALFNNFPVSCFSCKMHPVIFAYVVNTYSIVGSAYIKCICVAILVKNDVPVGIAYIVRIIPAVIGY